MDPDLLKESQKSGLLLVAICADQVVGFACNSEHDDELHLEELAVLPDYGRRGIGRALVEASLALAQTRQMRNLTLTTFADIPWNGPFYQRIGFVTLHPDELTSHLAANLAAERKLGLTQRIAMRYALKLNSA